MAKRVSKPDPQAVREKLRAFLKGGHPEDVASVVFHTLTQRAEVAAKVQQQSTSEESSSSEDKS